MENRSEFVRLATELGLSFSQLCLRFGISRKSGYNCLERAQGGQPLLDLARRRHASPRLTLDKVEAEVLALREGRPSWSSRKLHRRSAYLGSTAPAAPTIAAIRTRHGRIDPAKAARHRAFQRFEHPHPKEPVEPD